MIDAFEFEDGGRTYRCAIEEVRAMQSEQWWWFGVSGDQQRYAPFHAAADDTQGSVRSRIVTFYTDLLARRALPSTHYHWGQRNRGSAPVQK